MLSSFIKGYEIKTDVFPFTESLVLLDSTSDWWHTNKRKNIKHNSLNYTLNPYLSNSLLNSFKNKLGTGFFSFVYFNDEIVLYSGLRIENNEAYIHRMATNPFNHSKHLGVFSSILLPYFAKLAKEKNCTKLNITFNEDRYKLYRYLKEGNYSHNKFVKNKGGGEFIEHFEFIGKLKILYVDQYVCSLDLHKKNIDKIISDILDT